MSRGYLPVSIYLFTIHLIEHRVDRIEMTDKNRKLHVFCQNAIKFQTAIQQFCIMHYPGFIYTKNQLYTFPIAGLCFWARYEKWEP